MNLTSKDREVYNALSKEVFGASSRWQKLVTKGYRKIVTSEQEEIVPAAKEGEETTTRKVQVPVQLGRNSYAFTTERYTLDGVLKYMLERKNQLDLFKAALKKQQEEAQAKKEQERLAKKVHTELQGSAV